MTYLTLIVITPKIHSVVFRLQNYGSQQTPRVQKLIAFTYSSKEQSQATDIHGIEMVTDISIVAQVLGSLFCFVWQTFVDNSPPEVKKETAIEQFETWYGIVDLCHTNEAPRLLVMSIKVWKSYFWIITILNSGFGVEWYRRLPWFNNHRHNKSFYIDFTLLNEHNNLCEE